MGPITDRSIAVAKLEELATLATSGAAALAQLKEASVVDAILAGPDFDAKLNALTRLGDVPSYRAIVDAKLAEVTQLVQQGVLPNDISQQHAANWRATADSLDLVMQTVRNFTQAARDAKSDLPQ